MSGQACTLARIGTGGAFDRAGARLDAAAAELDRLCRPPAALPDEGVFAAAEAEYLDARSAYRDLVAERLGEEAETLARRLAL